MSVDRNSVSKYFAWKFSERLFSVGVNILVQIILARILDPKDFGILALLIAIINFASLFVSSGISTAIVQKKELDKEDISTTTIMCMVIALVVYLILFLGSPLFAKYYESPEMRWGLRVLAVIVFFNSFNSIQVALLSRRMNFKMIFIRSAISIPVSGVIGIAMALKGFGIWALIAHSVSYSILNVIVMAIGNHERIGFSFSAEKAKQIYSFSGYILFASLINGVCDMLRSLIIGKRYTKEDLAYYDKGFTYSTYLSQIAKESVSAVLLPVFSTEQSNIERLHDMTRESVKMISFIAFPILIGFSLISKEFVLIVLTEKWAKMVPFLILFCVLRLFDLLKSIDIQVFFAMGKTKMYFLFSILMSSLNLVFLIIAMRFGTIQIAVATVSVEILSTFGAFGISSSLFRYTLLERIKDMYKPIVSCTIMAGLILGFSAIGIENQWVVLLSKIAIGAGSYSCMELLLKDKTIKDCMSIAKRFLGK